MVGGSTDSSTDHEYSGWKEAALVLCLATTVLLMVAFLSPFWAAPATRDYDPNLEGIGLWKYCRWELSDNTEVHVCRNLGSQEPGWLKTTQALMSIGVAIMILALINIIASECCKGCRYDARGVLAFIIECFLAVIFCGSGVLVFGMRMQSHPVEENGTIVYMKIAWCFGLAVTSVILQLICGLLGVCELLFTRRPMNPVTFQVLRFSISFPGNLTSLASTNLKPEDTSNGGFDNVNFEEAEVIGVQDNQDAETAA